MRQTVGTYDTGQDKARALARYAWEDSRSALLRPVLEHVVRSLRAEIRTAAPGAMAQAIHRFVRDRIRYVRDPLDPRTGRREEQFADSGVVLRRGYDDCDGKARLVVALALVAGLEARIRAVFRVGDFVHVQAELRWPGSDRFQKAQRSGWVISETILRGVELGSGAEAGLRDAYGRPVYT